ncbi:hypothetical protein [Streptomyces sp. NPDC059176]|uniref:hypothetical protein n=1 Tax=Streptomyces sp. NPDC059176 TaxID=3346758 RepID=UPI00367BA2D6
MTIRIRRWWIEIYRRALHITRDPKPDPTCAACRGTGRYEFLTPGGDGDWEDCNCVDQLRAWRLPFGPRRTEEYPF